MAKCFKSLKCLFKGRHPYPTHFFKGWGPVLTISSWVKNSSTYAYLLHFPFGFGWIENKRSNVATSCLDQKNKYGISLTFEVKSNLPEKPFFNLNLIFVSWKMLHSVESTLLYFRLCLEGKMWRNKNTPS